MTQTTDSPIDAEGLRTGVDAMLAEHVSRLRSVLASVSDDGAELGEATAEMLAGGKRLRAAFCYWSWRAHGGNPADGSTSAVLGVGAALELFQAAALFHDDVMDDSDTRRGIPTAHCSFRDRHRAAGWIGDAVRFGEAAAILLGDLCLVGSEHEFGLAVAQLDRSTALAARTVFDHMRTEVTIGQYLDMRAQVQPWDSPEEMERRAREIVRAKSARYSLEHPVALGATLARASASRIATSRAFGLPLGEAFQLRDDLLGVFGDPAVTGKPAGDDLREGKRTVLLARALAVADESQRALLTSRVGAPDLDDEDIDRLRAVLLDTGAVAAVEGLIADLSERAFAELDRAGLDEPGAGMLATLARAAIDRRA